MRRLKYVNFFEDFKISDEKKIDEVFVVNRDGSWGAAKRGTGLEFPWDPKEPMKKAEGVVKKENDKKIIKEIDLIKSKVFEFFKECEGDLELKKSLDEVDSYIDKFTKQNKIPQLEGAKTRKLNLFLNKVGKTKAYNSLPTNFDWSELAYDEHNNQPYEFKVGNYKFTHKDSYGSNKSKGIFLSLIEKVVIGQIKLEELIPKDASTFGRIKKFFGF